MNDLLKSENLDDLELGCRIFIKNEEWNSVPKWDSMLLEKDDEDFNKFAYHEFHVIKHYDNVYGEANKDPQYFIADRHYNEDEYVYGIEQIHNEVTVYRVKQKNFEKFVNAWQIN